MVSIQVGMLLLKSKGHYPCGRSLDATIKERVRRRNGSHCCGYSMPKFMKTQTDKEREQKEWKITERGGDARYLCSSSADRPQITRSDLQ
jgi:hypothetical protein